jgi:cyclic beta-1,2-glucan synthetase
MMGKSRVTRLVLGFYGSVEHAQEALDEVRRNRFRRSATIHRAENGRLRIAYAGLSPYSRLAFAFTLALLLSLLSYVFAIAVFLITWFGTVWLGLGLEKKILRRYGRFVLPGESLVVVQETEERTADVIAVLRRIGHASVFTIRPGLPLRPLKQPEQTLGEAVTISSLPDCGAELAASHQLATSKRSGPLLPILRECEAAIERARADLGEAARLDYGIAHAAEWLLDNTYLIRSHIAEIRHNLPAKHNRIRPVIADTSFQIRFRIYHIAADFICRTRDRVAPDSIISFLNGYQQQAPLTIAELWVFPLMLRLVLLQRLQALSEMVTLRQHQKEVADFWANRLLNAANRGPEQFDQTVAELDRDGTELTPHFIARLGELLHKEESALAPIQKWIETKTGFNLADIILREHAEEANELMFISTAIGSLRQLSELQYPKIVETVSRMEAILAEDPSGIHARSDFATRDRCRRVVEACARQSKTSEWNVARMALELAQRAGPGRREGCVAFYLLDEGLAELEKRVGRRLRGRERRLRFLHRHPALVYLGGIAALTIAIVSGFVFEAQAIGVSSPLMLVVLGALALLPASELALYLVQMSLTWFAPPRMLPKMSFEEGIPEDCRTLVVVPMMLLTPDSIRGEIEKLEVRYLANPAPNLSFSLLADFTDAEQGEMPEDDDLLGLAAKGIEQLNARHRNRAFILFKVDRLGTQARQTGGTEPFS